MTACPFCRRIEAGEHWLTSHPEVVAFEPLGPVTPGHTLIVPREHLADACANTYATARVFAAAAELARAHPAANLITSVGADATQTVFHLHVHVVPRRPGDGLALPWTGQHEARPTAEDVAALLRQAAVEGRLPATAGPLPFLSIARAVLPILERVRR